MFGQVMDIARCPQAIPFIRDALKRSNGRFEVFDILMAIGEKRMQLWVNSEGDDINMVMVTEVMQWPRKRSLDIVILTGDTPSAWLGNMTVIEEFARDNDCASMAAWARPGWERLVDWKKTHVLLEKDLGHAQQ